MRRSQRIDGAVRQCANNGRTLERNPRKTGETPRMPRAIRGAFPRSLWDTAWELWTHQGFIQRTKGAPIFHVGRYAVASMAGVSTSTAQRHLRRLDELGITVRVDRGGYWSKRQRPAPESRGRGHAARRTFSPLGVQLMAEGVLHPEVAGHSALADGRRGPRTAKMSKNGRVSPGKMSHNDAPDHPYSKGVGQAGMTSGAGPIPSPGLPGPGKPAFEGEAQKPGQKPPPEATIRLYNLASQVGRAYPPRVRVDVPHGRTERQARAELDATLERIRQTLTRRSANAPPS